MQYLYILVFLSLVVSLYCLYSLNTNYLTKYNYDNPWGKGSELNIIPNFNKPHLLTKLGIIIISKAGNRIDKYDQTAMNIIQKYKGNKIIIQKEMKSRKDMKSIKSTLNHMLTIPNLNVILCIGGTGYSESDKTFETLNSYDKVEPITHFGTYFIGISERNHCAIGGRPSGFLFPYPHTELKRIPIFCIPGAPNSIETFCKHFLHNENNLHNFSIN